MPLLLRFQHLMIVYVFVERMNMTNCFHYSTIVYFTLRKKLLTILS